MSGAKLIPYCASCGSSEVRKDALAQWDEAFQVWTLVTTFDHVICQDCGERCDLEWRAQPTNEQEFQAIMESVVKDRDELLAALKLIWEIGLSDYGPASAARMVAAARAAIAKAKEPS